MVGGIFSRNIGTVSRGEQGKLAKSRVGLVGLGGTGGAAFEILVRLGVGNFVIFDGDRFESTNFNRQVYAVDTNIGGLKVDAAARKAKKINPKAGVERRGEEIDRVNVGMLGKCDVVLDCTDSVEARRMISSFCKRMKIPYVFCSAGGSMGMVSVFHGKSLDEVLGGVHRGKRDGRGKSVIAPAAFMAGSIAAGQALCVILGRKHVKAPEFVFFDMFSEQFLWKQKV